MGRRLSSVESIRQTLSLRNPEQNGVLVGSGAVALHMAEVGEYIRDVRDVDVVAEPLVVDAAQQDIPGGHANFARSGDKNVTIMPDYDARRFGILPYNIFTHLTDSKYSVDHHTIWFNEGVERLGALQTPTIKLGSMLRWMAHVGRERDVACITEVLDVAVDKGLVSYPEAEEIEALRTAAIKAATDAGGTYYLGSSR